MASSIRRFLCSLALVGLCVAGLSGCGSSEPEPPVETPALSDSEKALALHKAARAGDMDALRCSIKGQKTPVDVGDRYGTTALMMASDYGHEEVVRYLLAVGADVNHRETFFNTSALDLALWRERNEVAVVLIAAGADQREEAMEIAIREELPELARSRGRSAQRFDRRGVAGRRGSTSGISCSAGASRNAPRPRTSALHT